MKKSLLFGVMLLITAMYTHASWNGTDIESITKGTGTAFDPFLIENEAQWAWLSSMGEDLANAEIWYKEGVNYLITSDLDFNDNPFPMLAPLGKFNIDNKETTKEGEPYRFFGFLDGGNHTIRGVNLNLTGVLEDRSTGIIRAAGAGSVIANLRVEGGTIKNASEEIDGGLVRGGYYVGAIVGTANGKILQCAVIGTTVACRNESGGIAGTFSGGTSSLFKNNFVKDAVITGFGSWIGGATGWSNARLETSYTSIASTSSSGVKGFSSYAAQVGAVFVNSFANTDRRSDTGSAEGKTTADLTDASILDLLNAGQGTAWLIDTEGTINDGFPYLNNAYRIVLPVVDGATVAFEDGYAADFGFGGDELKFRITPNADRMNEGLTVKLGDVELISDDYGTYTVYTVENISERLVFTVEGELLKKTYTLEVAEDPISFDDITYGDAQPAERTITIRSTGNSDATISAVSLSGSALDAPFAIGGTKETAVSAGGTNETYTIQPKAGLNAGTYQETVTITYNSGEVEFDVKITVEKAELIATYEGETIRLGDTPELLIKVEGFVNDETVDTAAEYAAPTMTNDNTAPGTYTLTPEGGSADNYTFTYVGGDLEILQTYSVTYNANDADAGDVPVDTGSYISGDKAVVMDNNDLSLTDYKFVGWNTEADGSGDSYNVGDEIDIATADIILYAQWEIITGIALNRADDVAITTSEDAIWVYTPEVSTITLYDITGKTVTSKAGVSGETMLSVQGRFVGIVKVESKEGVVSMWKVAK